MNNIIVKELTFEKEASGRILSGVSKLTKAVASTLGAGGACVIYENDQGKPEITKDGVTVAKSVHLLDPVENIGATLIKEASEKTVKEAGDGTTTATVIAHSILSVVDKYEIEDSIRNVKNDIQSATDEVIEYLEKISIDVDDDMIDQVATISANNDAELGEIIGEAFRTVGKSGVVLMEENDTAETVVDFVEGCQIARGYKSPHFVTNKEKDIVELDNPLVLIVDSTISNVRKIETVLSYAIKQNRSMLIIGDLETQPLQALAMNMVKGYIKVNVIDPPDFGVHRREVMQDLAMLTGAKVISEELGESRRLF